MTQIIHENKPPEPSGTQGSKFTQAHSEPPVKANNTWCLFDLPMTDYEDAWDLQTSLVAARINKTINTDIALFLEHPAVFTLGRRGGSENLCVSRSFLKKSGISLIQVERGGDITYHGPGQLVVYFIVNLGKMRIGVKEFVSGLEEMMIRTAFDWGVPAKRSPVNAGIWVGNKKLGSIGIAIRKGISFHGLALNVNLSLEPFNWINPCGLHDVKMTSMNNALSASVSMPEVRQALKDHLRDVFKTRTRYLYPKPGQEDIAAGVISSIHDRKL